MSFHQKAGHDDLLGGIAESWVEVGSSSTSSSSQGGCATPGSITHTHQYDDYLRLLREAQESSGHTSPARRDSPRSSPKSPPNSPVAQGTPINLDWHAYYVNSETKEDAEFFTDWSSRPDQLPPKNWAFRPQKRDLLSIRCAKFGNDNLFSRKGLYTLFLTNLLSLLLGTGVGLWLSRHGFFTHAIKVR